MTCIIISFKAAWPLSLVIVKELVLYDADIYRLKYFRYAGRKVLYYFCYLDSVCWWWGGAGVVPTCFLGAVGDFVHKQWLLLRWWHCWCLTEVHSEPPWWWDCLGWIFLTCTVFCLPDEDFMQVHNAICIKKLLQPVNNQDLLPLPADDVCHLYLMWVLSTVCPVCGKWCMLRVVLGADLSRHHTACRHTSYARSRLFPLPFQYEANYTHCHLNVMDSSKCHLCPWPDSIWQQ